MRNAVSTSWCYKYLLNGSDERLANIANVEEIHMYDNAAATHGIMMQNVGRDKSVHGLHNMQPWQLFNDRKYNNAILVFCSLRGIGRPWKVLQFDFLLKLSYCFDIWQSSRW